MSDNRPEEEIASLFADVINGAHAAEHEVEDAFIDVMTSRMSMLLDTDMAPVHTLDIEGRRCVAIPEEIMTALLSAINDFCDFNAEIIHQADLGNAAVLLGPLMDDTQMEALVVKTAFIAMAMIKRVEREGAE